MNRKDVVIPAGDLEKQRDFTRRAAGYLARLGREPRAFVDTYGCQQNVSDSQRIMGMLREMGCAFTDSPAQAAATAFSLSFAVSVFAFTGALQALEWRERKGAGE